MAIPVSIFLPQLALGASTAPSEEAKNIAAVEEEMAELIRGDNLLTQQEWDFTTAFLSQHWESGALKGLNNFLKQAADNPNWSISPAALQTLSNLGPKGVDQVAVQTIANREKEAVRIYSKLIGMVGVNDPLTVEEWNNFTPEMSIHFRDGGVDGLRFFLREVSDSEGKLKLERGVKTTFETAPWAKRVIHRNLLSAIKTVKPAVVVAPPPEPKKVAEFGTLKVVAQDELGERLKGVRLQISSEGFPADLSGQPTETSKKGQLILEPIPIGEFQVAGELDGYESTSAIINIAKDHRTVITLTLTWIPKERITEKMALSWLSYGVPLNPVEQELLIAFNQSVDRHGVLDWDRFGPNGFLKNYLDQDLNLKKGMFQADGVRRSFFHGLILTLKRALSDRSITVGKGRVTPTELARIVDGMDAEDIRGMWYTSAPAEAPAAGTPKVAAPTALDPGATALTVTPESEKNLVIIYTVLHAIKAGERIWPRQFDDFQEAYAWLRRTTKTGTGYDDFLRSITNPVVYKIVETPIKLDRREYAVSPARLIFASEGNLDETVADMLLDDFKKYEEAVVVPQGSDPKENLAVLTYFSGLLNYLEALMGRVKEEEKSKDPYFKLKSYRDTLATKVQGLYNGTREKSSFLITSHESPDDLLDLLLEIGWTEVIKEENPDFKKALADGFAAKSTKGQLEAAAQDSQLISTVKTRISFARSVVRPSLARGNIPQPLYDYAVQEIFTRTERDRVVFGTAELEALLDLAQRGVAFLRGQLAKVSENETAILARQAELKGFDANTVAEESGFLTSWLRRVTEQKTYLAQQLELAERLAPYINRDQLMMAARLITTCSNVTVEKEVQERLAD